MKKIIVAFVVLFSLMSLQQAGAQKVKQQKIYTTPKGKVMVHTTRSKKKAVHYPQGKAVGWHGRNPNRAKGKLKH